MNVNVFLGPAAIGQDSADYTLEAWAPDGTTIDLTGWWWTETANGGYIIAHANLYAGCSFWLRKTSGGTPWTQGEVRTILQGSGLVATESAPGMIEVYATSAAAGRNAIQQAAQRGYFQKLICASGYKFVEAEGNPITATFSGTIATGKRLVLQLEYEDGANTFRDKDLGFFDDTLTFYPEAAFTLDLSGNAATLKAYNDGIVTPGTLTVTCANLWIGTAPSTVALDVPALGDTPFCYLHWDHNGRCVENPLLAAAPLSVADMKAGGIASESAEGEIQKVAQRTLDRVAVSDALAAQDIVSITAEFTGTITGNAILRVYLVQVGLHGFAWSSKKLVGHVEAGGAWVDNGGYSGDYAAGIAIQGWEGTGTLSAGTLTLTITDQQGEYTREIELGENARHFFAYLGKQAGQLIGYGGADSVDAETMTQTVREPTSATGGGEIPAEQFAELAKEATVLGNFGITVGIVQSNIVRNGSTIVVARGDTTVLTIYTGRSLVGKKLYFTVKERMEDDNADAIVLEECTIINAASGIAQYASAEEDFATAGRRMVYDFEVRNADDSGPETVFIGSLIVRGDVKR